MRLGIRQLMIAVDIFASASHPLCVIVGEWPKWASAKISHNPTRPPKLPLSPISQKTAGAPEKQLNASAARKTEGVAYLLELLDGTGVNSTALVDQVCMSL